MKGYTPIKNGLFTKQHLERLGDSWILFGKYLSFTRAPKSTRDPIKQEACVFVYPNAIQKQLDIDKETWKSYHANLENQGYISTQFLANSDAIVVCIKKALL